MKKASTTYSGPLAAVVTALPQEPVPQVPVGMLDVALVSAETVAALADISISTWHAMVRAKAAPQPARRGHRFTRWRWPDVRDWLVGFAAQGTDSDASRVIINATRASAAAKAARRAKASPKAAA